MATEGEIGSCPNSDFDVNPRVNRSRPLSFGETFRTVPQLSELSVQMTFVVLEFDYGQTMRRSYHERFFVGQRALASGTDQSGFRAEKLL